MQLRRHEAHRLLFRLLRPGDARAHRRHRARLPPRRHARHRHRRARRQAAAVRRGRARRHAARRSEADPARPGTSIDIVTFTALAVDAARQAGAGVIVRGLRDATDFDYETKMAGMNGAMAPGSRRCSSPPRRGCVTSPRASCGRSRDGRRRDALRFAAVAERLKPKALKQRADAGSAGVCSVPAGGPQQSLSTARHLGKLRVGRGGAVRMPPQRLPSAPPSRPSALGTGRDAPCGC